MNQRSQYIVLGVLLLVLAGAGFYFYRMYAPADHSMPGVNADEKFTPLPVDNPALRLDILKRFLELQYKGAHRSIFSATLPPPPAPPPSTVKAPVNVPPPMPSGPPPLTVDAKYFGFVSDFSGNHRRAFFSAGNNGEDVVIAGEGDTLFGRFRVIRLTATTADVEEVSSGRRATLTLEEPSPNG